MVAHHWSGDGMVMDHRRSLHLMQIVGTKVKGYIRVSKVIRLLNLGPEQHTTVFWDDDRASKRITKNISLEVIWQTFITVVHWKLSNYQRCLFSWRFQCSFLWCQKSLAKSFEKHFFGSNLKHISFCGPLKAIKLSTFSLLFMIPVFFSDMSIEPRKCFEKHFSGSNLKDINYFWIIPTQYFRVLSSGENKFECEKCTFCFSFSGNFFFLL